MDMIQVLAQELDKLPQHVANVVQLLDEGNTIPFIARYRKELHGAMDDTALRTLEERLQYLRNLQERRETVKKSIEEQGKLTEELSGAIDAAVTLAEVEDLYRPYKQTKRSVFNHDGFVGFQSAFLHCHEVRVRIRLAEFNVESCDHQFLLEDVGEVLVEAF